MASQHPIQHAQLLNVLRHHYPDVLDGLFVVPETGRILGFIATDALSDYDYYQRQDRLWEVLDRSFSPEALEDIGPITVMTLEDAELRERDLVLD